MLSLIVVMVIGTGVTARSQAATATLSGIVADSTGAAIAEADISVVNTDSGFARSLRSAADGTFSVPDLPPGPYRVVVRRAGFAPASVPSDLHVGDRLSLNIRLTIGKIEDDVTVLADAPLVQNDPAVGTLVTREFVENQPLNGRSFQSLVQLSPGITLTPTNVTQSGQFSVNGQRPDTNYFTIDGVSANFGVNSSGTLYQSSGGALPAYSALGGTNNLASVNAVQEFRIETSTYAPEFGRQPGAQVAVVTRSGANELRGSVFEYLRNDVFDANDYFANRNGLKRPALRQNDFGFVVGGPIKRNKTFFFGSYEGLRLRQPLVSSPIFVATVAARQAATGLAKDILNAFPLPNGAVNSTDPSVASFAAGYSDPSTLNATSVRIDHSIGNRWQLFGRYNNSPSKISQRAIFATANSIQDATSDTQTVTVGLTGVLSPRFSNDLRFNYSRNEAGSRYRLDNFGGAIVPSDAAFFPSFTDPTRSTSSITLGPSTGSPLTYGLNAINLQRQLNIVETFTLVTGAHSFKFGVDYRRLSPIQRGALYRRFLTFNTTASALSGTVNTLRQIGTDLYLYPIYNNYSAFGQDVWQIGPKLTLTFGLRYDVNPAPGEKNGNLPLTVANLASGAPTLVPQGTALYKTTFGNIAPRFGAAYRVGNVGTVLRGGVGMFYDLGYTFTGSAFSTFNFPFANTVTQSNVPLSSPAINATVPPVSITPPYGRLFAYAPDYKLPYTVEYNFTVEQPIRNAGVLSLGYVGALGRRMGRVTSLRNPVANLGPNFTRIDEVTNDATSNYNALQAKYQHHLSRRIQALASYSFSKSLDTVSDETIVNFQAPSLLLNPNQDRGPSSFDVRHSASAGISYEIPSPLHGAAHLLTEGFGLDAMFQARSALPLNILTGRDTFNLGFATVTRPNVVAGNPFYIDDPKVAGGRRINLTAFSVPPNAVQGNFGRNVLRGFPASQLDLSLRRRVTITERDSALFRIDAFNILNHPNFATPNGIMTDPTFGLSTQMLGRSLGSGGTSGGFNPLYQLGGPRSMQLSLTFQF
jgi:Carboxypeptidase regulatory-like domain/TonB dependent receptor